MKISREVRIGITVVAAIGFFVWGFNYLKGRDVFIKERKYYAIYNSVMGLTTSNPVYINGYKVGLVKDMGFHPDGSNRILVTISVTNDIPIPANSIVRIYGADLMGTKAVEIKLGNSGTLARSGDTLHADVQASFSEEVNKQVLPLKDKALSLMISIDSAMFVLRAVFNEQTRLDLQSSFASIKTTVGNLEHLTGNLDTLMSSQRGKLSSILGNIDAISANIKGNSQKINTIIQNFSSISDTLARIRVTETINHLNHSLAHTNSILEKIDKGEGSIGLLINSDSLHRELSNSTKDLDLLLKDIRLHPKRYLNFSVFPAKQ